MSDIEAGDRVRRTEPCACTADSHQVGWEGRVASLEGLITLRFTDGTEGIASSYTLADLQGFKVGDYVRRKQEFITGGHSAESYRGGPFRIVSIDGDYVWDEEGVGHSPENIEHVHKEAPSQASQVIELSLENSGLRADLAERTQERDDLRQRFDNLVALVAKTYHQSRDI